MFSWAGRLGSGLGHSLGAVDSSQTSLTRDIDIKRHVLGKGTFPGDARDLADVILTQTQISRLLHEIETLEAEVTHWKKLCQCSTQGPNTINTERLWKLKSHIRDLEQRWKRELDKHQLEVAGLQNTHWRKLADLTDRHRQQLRDYQRMDQLSKEEIGKLTQIIQQKDLEFQDLSRKISVASHCQNAHMEQLQRQLQECTLKSEQVLVVLNEKTRENSNLKRNYHRMTNRLAAKEEELQMKMQEENQKLSTRIESSDIEVFREMIRNLSHIIREKDLEVDALSQKCQTLMTILQTPSTGHAVGGVSIDQFQQLLQERDTLRQWVTIMEEWKEQVLTTVQNMKRESPQLQRDLRQLQAWACTNSEVLRLQTTSLDQIHTYQGHEINLQELEKELAQLQLRIRELCNAKELLLGNPDAIFLRPSSDSAEAADSLKAMKSDRVSESSQVLREEVEELRKSGQGKDKKIQTLQEDQQRRVASGAATGEGEGKPQEQSDSDSHMEQQKEKQAVLQDFPQAQELRIPAKSEELLSLQAKLRGQLSENELLRQAVTSLKERIADFEMDVCRLKEENGKMVETCIKGHGKTGLARDRSAAVKDAEGGGIPACHDQREGTFSGATAARERTRRERGIEPAYGRHSVKTGKGSCGSTGER